MRALSTLLALLLLLPGIAAAADPAPLSDASKAWAAALPKGAVATAEKRDGAWRYALHGQPFAEGHAPVPAERVLFEIGSISKVFTGVLLAQAVNEGRLALTDTLATRLPDVKFHDPVIAAITLEQLATHSSCLPRLPSNMATADARDPYASYDDADLRDYLSLASLGKQPPCPADYSNLGFGVLGVVVERALGKPWAALVQERIAAPLGMTDTAQALSEDQLSRFALPWDGDEAAAPWTFQAMSGAGALRSTLLDMSRFADALLAGSSGPLAREWPLLSAKRAEMPAVGGHVGLALVSAKDHGEEALMHDGGTGGYRSSLVVKPSSGRATVVLASNADAAPPAWLAAWQAAQQAPAARTEVTLPPETLDEYAGSYALDPKTKFTLGRHGGGLVARLTGQPFSPIFASAKDEFFFKVVDAQLSFRRGATGRIEGVTLKQNGRELPATRTADAAPKVEIPDAAALADFAGDYDFGAFMPGGSFSVKPGPGALVVQLTGQPALLAFPAGRDRWEYDVVPAALVFERDAAGRVVALVLHQNGMEMRAPRK